MDVESNAFVSRNGRRAAVQTADPFRGDENSLIDFRTPNPFNGHSSAAYRCPTHPARGAERHERAHNPLPARLHRFS